MHVMIDLETMSTRPNAAVASIGAVGFNPYIVSFEEELRNGPTFYANIDLEDQSGRAFDGSTIYWWLTLPPEAQRGIMSSSLRPVRETLKHFEGWCREFGFTIGWSHGANFDHVILNDLYNWAGMHYPLAYKHQLCARTLYAISGVPKPEVSGVMHNSLDDAICQTIWLQKALRQLCPTDQ